MKYGVQPDNNSEARVLRMKASHFTIVDDVLFKKSATGLLQKCLKRDEADIVMDVYESDFGNHTNRRNLSLKILCMGYYWQTLKQNVLNYTRKCDSVNDKHLSFINR